MTYEQAYDAVKLQYKRRQAMRNELVYSGLAPSSLLTSGSFEEVEDLYEQKTGKEVVDLKWAN
ncbi:hypothetical protein CBS101457_002715 [Exobasidium rhododendri]|nr:hypothetical protein CBS101457_002715 [Exobasidium rhododendri]